ncbi:hypothetical protein KIH74_14140 [Kineosporia sp. J2-2]|uniref:Uncharacterized protein n=1 Tax=Kineosporia corallincola TaxID=2835133 RepID=A0ABS5TG54_9ACTN|nr:hypothetical protein [Kineosporia corallincola]MBT0770075.1 hypothetical protein [Kineosporia corallincola]
MTITAPALTEPPFTDHFTDATLHAVLAGSVAVQIPMRRIAAEPAQELDGVPGLAPAQQLAKENVLAWADTVQPMLTSAFTGARQFAGLYGGLSDADIAHLTDGLTSATGQAEFLDIVSLLREEAARRSHQLRETAVELRSAAGHLDADSAGLREIAAAAFEQAGARDERIPGLLERMGSRAAEATHAVARASSLAPFQGLAIAVGMVGGDRPGQPGVVSTWLAASGTGPVQAGLLQQHLTAGEQYRHLFGQLRDLAPQCATLRWLLDDVVQMIGAGFDAATTLSAAGEHWQHVADYFGLLADAVRDDLAPGQAALFARSLRAVHEQVMPLREAATDCERNSLVPVVAADATVRALRLPSSWAGRPIDADVFSSYLRKTA